MIFPCPQVDLARKTRQLNMLVELEAKLQDLKRLEDLASQCKPAATPISGAICLHKKNVSKYVCYTWVYMLYTLVSGTNPGQNMDIVDTLPMDIDAIDSLLSEEPPKLFHIISRVANPCC